MKKFSLVTKIDHSKVLELFEDVSITDHSENQYHTKNMNDDMRKHYIWCYYVMVKRLQDICLTRLTKCLID